jgi:NitT/TauT family transport system ATP-binding protein
MAEKIVEFQNVSKMYPQESGAALHDATFSVCKGEFICIIGPSGCGKSTVLKLIAGLEKPTGGTIKKPESVAMVFQTGALFPWLTVRDNVALVLEAKGAAKAKARSEAAAFLKPVGLGDMSDKYPADLSGGQRQRVGIARALAVNPEVLLLDEPFSALDPKITAELHEDVLKIWDGGKKTIVMVSHSIEEAVSLADEVILMKSGTISHTFPIKLPYPRLEQEAAFTHRVLDIRRAFFA